DITPPFDCMTRTGAVPGPVCYRPGGGEPTLTDANLILGYLNPEALLGGALPIDREYAATVFEEKVARPLGLGLPDAAFGAHQIAVASMVRVVKAVSSERGRDPRGFTLVGFGGNGPVHAARVAAELGMRQVVIPPWPGLFSAFGLLSADLTHHFSRTILRPTGSLRASDLERFFFELEAEARAAVVHEGYRPDGIAISWAADLRYVGQSYELRLPVAAGRLDTNALADLDERFGAEHERTYGHRAAADPIEVVNLRVTASARRSEAPDPGQTRALAHPERPATTRRLAYFGPKVGLVDVPVLGRQQVDSAPLAGPLIVEEYDATTVVPPGGSVRRDDWDNLVIDLEVLS
ncbi:MAG: hydantoinase/oxoprolinase family protein, partial [Chloroflexota bacterium]